MPYAVCIGHSHAAAVAAAVQARGAAVDVVNFWELPGAVSDDGSVARLADSVLARLRAPVFSLVGGAVHHDIGLLLHPVPFDFIDPAVREAPSPGATLIPYDAVRAAMQARIAPYLRIMDAVRRAVSGAMFHLQSPPIFAGEAPEEDKPDWVAFHGAGRSIAPAPFRRRLWRLHSALVAAHCQARGIGFVPCPADSMDEAGYLRPGLNGRPAHANAAYGGMVLDQVLALAAQAQPA